MTPYLPVIISLLLVVISVLMIVYVWHLFDNFLNTSNTKIGIWLRRQLGPAVQSAGHAILREDLTTVGFCPGCGSAIKKNQAVWMIAQIPRTDEDIPGKLKQAHCLFYMDKGLLRVAVCMNMKCRETSHKSDIFAIIGEDGKPVKQSPMLGYHRLTSDAAGLFEGITSITVKT